MHEEHQMEKQLRLEAERISAAYRGAPVVVIVTGDTAAGVPRTMIASTLHSEQDRLRDLLGILQTAIQIETLRHFRPAKLMDQVAKTAAQAVQAIRHLLERAGGRTRIPKLRRGTFQAELEKDGIRVDNLGSQPLLPWAAFEETVGLLIRNGGRAPRGDAQAGRLGDRKLPLDSVEGHIAHSVYGKHPGDSVLRRITPVACILIWAGVCEHAPGELILKGSDWAISEQP